MWKFEQHCSGHVHAGSFRVAHLRCWEHLHIALAPAGWAELSAETLFGPTPKSSKLQFWRFLQGCHTLRLSPIRSMWGTGSLSLSTAYNHSPMLWVVLMKPLPLNSTLKTSTHPTTLPKDGISCVGKEIFHQSFLILSLTLFPIFNLAKGPKRQDTSFPSFPLKSLYMLLRGSNIHCTVPVTVILGF